VVPSKTADRAMHALRKGGVKIKKCP